MVAGDCSKSRECSPVRNSLTAGSPALPNLMVTSSEDCSRSRECSPVRNSVAFEDARTLPNLMITNKDCSKSRECSPDGSFGTVTEPSHTREVSLCSRDHAPEEDTCYNADSNKDPAERNSSTGITKSDTAPVTPPHVTEKTAKVAVSIRKEVPLSSKVSPINSDSGCASPSSVDVSDTLPRQEDTRPGICKAPVTVFKSSLSVMPSASTQVGHSSSTSRAPMATGRCRQKRSAGNTETKASKLGASPEVTPTTSKTLTRSVSRRENKQTTAKSKKVATPTSRGNITRQKSDPLPAVAPAPNTDRTPATPVAVGRRQQKHSAQKADSKVPKLRAQLEVTPAISKTVPRDASRRGSNTAKRRKATSTPVVNSLSVCNTPTIDGGASKKRLNSAEDASPSLPTGVSGSTRSCSASASRSQLTGKKVRQLRGRILRNARDESISPTLNISLSRNCSSPVSSDIAIRKSSLRPRAKAVEAQPSPATTPAAESDLIPNTSIKVTRSVSRSAKDLRRRRSLKLRATPATPCGIKSSLEKSKNRCRRRRTSPKSTALQSSPLPGTMLTSNNSPMEQEDAGIGTVPVLWQLHRQRQGKGSRLS
ncbi:hypothetical protein TELCIR_10461 [Teladorsagia circumcincta]|uniref:Uncharacterized protein n=1 Tax=Teladorsagia circumcincta TaxID=45464 RepID=A0A2G9UC16_TELCI|nr:hypothetical protein TELCIR_10461 [Teladorsagia circumcincta]